MSIFFLIAVVTLGYSIYYKVGFNFIFLAYLSTSFYFFPLFFGFSLYPGYQLVSLDERVYVVALFIFFPFFFYSIATYFFSNGRRRAGKNQFSFKVKSCYFNGSLINTFYFFLLFFIFSYLLFFISPEVYDPDKNVVMSAISPLHYFFTYMSIVLIIDSALRQKYIFTLLFSFFIFHDLYIGFRVFFVIAIISFFVVFYYGRGVGVKNILVGFFIFLILIAYKPLYASIKSGNFDHFYIFFLSPEMVFSAIQTLEPLGIVSILNEVLVKDFFVPFELFLEHFISIFPFARSLFEIEAKSYNQYFQYELFGDVGYGMANSFWAYAYSLGGYFGVLVSSIIYFLLVYSLQKIYFKKSLFLAPVVITVAVLVSFYIHRNDLVFMLIQLKYVFFVLVFIYILFNFIKLLHNMVLSKKRFFV